MAHDPKLAPGCILLANDFYADTSSGQLLPKYVLVLAHGRRSGDLVWRLLTSRRHGRPEIPACYHGDPYPGFHLGVICPEVGLKKQTWLDLRGLDDGDMGEACAHLASGRLQHIFSLDLAQCREASLCVAAADDTTMEQEASIRDQLASSE